MNDTSALELYVIRRSGWHTPDALQASAARSADVGDNEMSDDIRWIRSYVVKEHDGTLGTVCIYQASSADKVREHAGRAGIPAQDVLPIVETLVIRPDPAAVAA